MDGIMRCSKLLRNGQCAFHFEACDTNSNPNPNSDVYFINDELHLISDCNIISLCVTTTVEPHSALPASRHCSNEHGGVGSRRTTG